MLLATIVEASPDKQPSKSRRLSLGVNIPVNERPVRGLIEPPDSPPHKAPPSKALFDDEAIRQAFSYTAKEFSTGTGWVQRASRPSMPSVGLNTTRMSTGMNARRASTNFDHRILGRGLRDGPKEIHTEVLRLNKCRESLGRDSRGARSERGRTEVIGQPSSRRESTGVSRRASIGHSRGQSSRRTSIGMSCESGRQVEGASRVQAHQKNSRQGTTRRQSLRPAPISNRRQSIRPGPDDTPGYARPTQSSLKRVRR